jgi:hypothetical protein
MATAAGRMVAYDAEGREVASDELASVAYWTALDRS